MPKKQRNLKTIYQVGTYFIHTNLHEYGVISSKKINKKMGIFNIIFK